MPRGKFLNHKGQSRQFTPVEELQREHELEWKLNSNFHWQFDKGNGNAKDNINNIIKTNNNIENSRIKKLAGAVEGLIEISNPNRTQRTVPKSSELNTDCQAQIQDRSDKIYKSHTSKTTNQKSVGEIKADIERLALVRKKREAAAEIRLAAKKLNSLTIVTPIVKSKSDMCIKKKGQKHKSNATGSINHFRFDNENDNDNDIRKLNKGRNGNKRNDMLNV
ncbi:hypothetical protein ACLKA7_006072 [Drosophila subpalustris]